MGLINTRYVKGLIFDILRGTTHDGPGIRTTVFFKGCPLNCLWCQNPEGINNKPEIQWIKQKCISCFNCKAACKENALIIGPKKIHIDWSKCILCGACTEACPAKALQWLGKEWTVEQLVKEVNKDKIYFETFSGGVTASGGEPLFQYTFVREFFKKLKKIGINTALDTCGLASTKALDVVLPYTDYVLYDIKFLDIKQHKKYTGQTNEIILTNLLYTAKYIRKRNGKIKMWLRTPLIIGSTATRNNIMAISNFIKENINDLIERWELCAFNVMCKDKYDKLNRNWYYKNKELLKQSFTDELCEAALQSGRLEGKVFVTGLAAKDNQASIQ